jgi:hypothetical protein
MRTAWKGLAVDAVDYEILTISASATSPPLGAFQDVFVAEGPPWRLVAGYLMLEEAGPGELRVFSHGKAVAALHLSTTDAVWRTTRPGSVWAGHSSGVRADGIALLPTTGELTTGPTEMRVTMNAPWAVTVVHGPAPEKIDARIALHESLQRVGGRHG